MVLACTLPAARGEVVVTLPTGHLIQAGRYTPVHLFGSTNGATWLELRAIGTVTTRVLCNKTGRIDQTVPWLVLSSAVTSAAECVDSNGIRRAIHIAPAALFSTQKTVGVSNDVVRDFARSTGMNVVDIDPTIALPGPVGSWANLNELVVYASSLPHTDIAAALACGTTVTVTSRERPDGLWPWEQHGATWTLRPSDTGPGGAVEPRAYLPVWNWTPGTPYLIRRRVVLAAVLFSIVALGMAVAGRRATVAVVAFSVIACTGAYAWNASAEKILSARGQVSVNETGLETTDDWMFQTTHQTASARFDVESNKFVMPILTDPEQAKRLGLTLVVSPQSDVYFLYRLNPNAMIAFVQRTVRPAPMTPDLKEFEAIDSPLRPSVNALYLGMGREIVGVINPPEIDGIGTEAWQGVRVKGRN